jgi:hypothetical protein
MLVKECKKHPDINYLQQVLKDAYLNMPQILARCELADHKEYTIIIGSRRIVFNGTTKWSPEKIANIWIADNPPESRQLCKRYYRKYCKEMDKLNINTVSIDEFNYLVEDRGYSQCIEDGEIWIS